MQYICLVLPWIMNYVSKEIFGGIVYAVDASAVWTDLKYQFDKVNGSGIFFHQEIGRLAHVNNSLSSYYCMMKQLWDEYSSLVVLPSCACDTAKQYLVHDQQQKLLQFLLGLTKCYAQVRSQILMMTPMPSIGEDFFIISEEESHILMSIFEAPSSVFFSVQGKSNPHKKDTLQGDYCHRIDHIKEFCYKLNGYAPDHKLYKANGGNKGQHGQVYRDNVQRPTPSTNLSNVAQTNDPSMYTTDVTNVSAAPLIFTPAQDAEILKILGSHKVQYPAEPVVNMADESETKRENLKYWCWTRCAAADIYARPSAPLFSELKQQSHAPPE